MANALGTSKSSSFGLVALTARECQRMPEQGHILMQTCDPISRYGDMLSAWLEGLDRSGTGNSHMFNVVEFVEK